MKTEVEELEPTKVKLTVEVESDRVSKAVDAAARELAEQIQMPGFRKGKVPRRLLEAKVGKEALLAQALESAVSTFYAEAIEGERLRVVAPPDIELQHFDEDEGCAFEATVEISPTIDLPDHSGIDVAYPEWDVTDGDIEDELAELRDRFAELDEVDRPARPGDYVTLDLQVAREGEVVEDASVEDALYEVGSGGVTPELDVQLGGAVAGQVLVYTDELPEDYPVHGGETVEFTVTVHDVREKELPELDDDFALTASEFDTIEELREDIRAKLLRQRITHARQQVRAQALEAYLALVDVPLPEALVEGEREGRLEQLRRQAERYGVDLAELLEAQGTDLEQYTEQIAEQSRNAVKAQLVLEALAEELDIEVESADLGREVRRHAMEHGISPEEIARLISEQGTAGVLVGDVIRRKALDAIVEAADVSGGPPDDVLEEIGLVERPPDESTAVDVTADMAAESDAPAEAPEPEPDPAEVPAEAPEPEPDPAEEPASGAASERQE